jgi:hypothetical protein
MTRAGKPAERERRQATGLQNCHNPLMAGKPSMAKRIVKYTGLILLAALIFGGWRYGPTLYDFYKAGFFEDVLSQKELRKYQGTSMDNLKALHVALSLYHESEGQFPHSSGWMDAVQPYIRTGDMKKEEAMKKLINPLILPGGKGVFGYAMNDATSARYKDDIPFPSTTPLLFDSSNTSWNAHGTLSKLLPKPPRQGGNLGISVSGEILEFDEKGKAEKVKSNS